MSGDRPTWEEVVTTLWPGQGGLAPEPAAPEDPSQDDPWPHPVLGELGRGGMGTVLKVRDALLGRSLALKHLRPGVSHPIARARFVNEAILTARLEHPGIVPVHALGVTADGTPWYTMRRIAGATLQERILDVHHPGRNADGWTLRRLLDAFQRICETLAYAHSRGVIHRDLKPSNVLLGEHGETWVVDWGLAKQIDDDGLEGDFSWDEDPAASGLTQAGDVAGTPGYLAPEQALGILEQLRPHTDVFALGAVLFAICTGESPYDATDPMLALARVASGPPPDLRVRMKATPEVPDEIVDVCERALAVDPADRYPDAAALLVAIQAWSAGTRRREQADAVVARAREALPEAATLRAKAVELRARAAASLESLPETAPESDKHEAWALEDEADRRELDAALREVEHEQLLLAALTHDPDHIEAHAALADRYLDAHAAAERARDPIASARAERRMGPHVQALPATHPVRVRCASWLEGSGAVSLHVVPANATVRVERYVARDRRLVLEPVDTWTAPVDRAPLPHGSYRLTLSAPGCADVRYPVAIDRGEHWHPVRPGDEGLAPIALPGADTLGPDDCLVPAGPARLGGDPRIPDALPACRPWVDAFVIQRFPVTNEQFIDFLDDLHDRGLTEQAEAAQPRERDSSGSDGHPLYVRDPSGHFELPPTLDPNLPVILVDVAGANAYIAWRRERDGLDWRLPTEWEWEKAARGVDGRFHPWGDWMDASRCATKGSQRHHMQPAAVDAFPVDESPYGVRGLAGNVQDWCSGPFDRSPAAPRLAPTADARIDTFRITRGGYWFGFPDFSRSAHRVALVPIGRSPNVGFRLARSWSPR